MNLRQIGKYDGMILGAALGILIAKPNWSGVINSFLTDIIPTSIGTNIFGEWTVPIYAVLLGALLGFIAERSR